VSHKPKYNRDVRWGLWVGLQFALGYSLIALAILALSGELASRYGWVVLGRYASVYFVTGILGGLTYGLLKPITDKRWGLMLVLAVVGVIVYTLSVYTYLDLKHKPSEPAYWLITVIVGIGFGIGAGDKIWENRSKRA
jgi:Na+/melibiose symporter-like transporter